MECGIFDKRQTLTCLALFCWYLLVAFLCGRLIVSFCNYIILLMSTEPTIGDVLGFLREHMPTRHELSQIREDMAKEASIDKLYNTFDAFAKETHDERQENVVLRDKVHRMEY